MRRYAALFSALGILVCGVSCEDDPKSARQYPPHDPVLVEYLRVQFGTYMDEFRVNEYGDTLTSGTLTVTLDDFGSRQLYMEEIVAPVADGGGVLLHLEDIESGDTRFFDYNPEDNVITFGQDLLDENTPGFKERGVAVHRQEDGQYAVWTFDDSAGRENEQVVADGYAVLEIVNEYAEFSTIPPHIMMTAIALGHTTTPEVRTITNCNPRMTAAPPTICSVFKEFCDCAACQVLGRDGANCDLCPQL